jgi:exopolysaccharide biosynthesis polyprenyl glycosylphosphotransferase
VAIDNREMSAPMIPAQLRSISGDDSRSFVERTWRPQVSVSLPLDAAACFVAWLLAFLTSVDALKALELGVLATVVNVLAAKGNGAYRSTVRTVPVAARSIVLKSCFETGALVYLGARAFDRPVGLVPCVIGSVAAATAALLVRRTASRLAGKNYTATRVLVMADDRETRSIVRFLAENEDVLGWSLCGIAGGTGRAAHGVRWYGPDARSLEAAEEARPDVVVLASEIVSDEPGQWLLAQLRREGIPVHIYTGLQGIDGHNVHVVPARHEAMLLVAAIRASGYQRFLKRALDVVLGCLLLLVALPIITVAAIAIKFDDRGPIFFRQRRVGRDGRTFTMVKLRTMCTDAERRLAEIQHMNERTGPLFKVSSDPRVTRVGRFFRSSSIDELPQLWNVVRGDMSLVGPRPALPHEVATFDPRLSTRHNVRPGMTGIWQVEQRDEPDFDGYRRLDVFYVENWSVSLDLAILIGTIPAVLDRARSALQRKRPEAIDLAAS